LTSKPVESGPGPAGAEYPNADPEGVARRIALTRLTQGPRTRAELEGTMAKRGVPAEAAGAVLDRFEEVGLIDDAAFARAWVQSRHAGRGLARRALASELRRRGVDDEVAGPALDEVGPDAELTAAHRLVVRKLRSLRGLDRQVQMRRLTGMLARKGYPAGLAVRVVRAALDEATGSEDEPLP
jgi:regulatory protein